MEVLKRALLYNIRKKRRSLTLFLLFLLITTFVTVSFSVWSATRAAVSRLRSAVGASFSVRGNASGMESGADGSAPQFYPVLQRDIDVIAGSAEVSDYNAQQSGVAYAGDFDYPSGLPCAAMAGNTATERNRYFMEGTLLLAQGRHITGTDRAAVLVSRELAEENRVGVGDSLMLHAAPESGGKNTEVQIAGIYESDPDMEFGGDTLFITQDAFCGLTGEAEGAFHGKVEFFVTDPAELPKAVEAVQTIRSIDWEHYILDTDTAEYDAVAYQLSTIGRLTMLFIVFTAVVSAIILWLILAMRIKGRMREAGVLLAVGIERRKVVVQFVLEAAVLLVLTFPLSGLICFLAAAPVESYLRSLSGTVFVSVPAGRLFVQYAIELMVVAAGAGTAAYPVIRLSPKDILVKMS